jgi:hypothetical protein
VINNLFDKFGVCVSGICLIHCLTMPIFLILFPTVSAEVLHEDIVHLVFGITVILLSLTAIIPNCREHEHRDIFYLALAGASIIILALIIEPYTSETLEHILTILGSITLMTAHFKNMKVRHGKCDTLEENSCSHAHK